MKKVSILLLFIMLVFGAFTYYFMFYANGGADGLSSFIPFVFSAILFLCAALAFLLSLFLKKNKSKKARNWLLGVAVALPVLGFLSVSAIFSSFSSDYQKSWDAQIEKEKTVLDNLTYLNKDFGVSFEHVSGRVHEYKDGQPIPISITPYVENNSLIVPVDDNAYLSPNILLKTDFGMHNSETNYFENLKKELDLVDATLEKQSLSDFENLEANTSVWSIDTSYENREKIAKYFTDYEMDSVDLIYLLKSQKNPKVLWVLIVSSTIYSAPAKVADMSTSNFEAKNLWFYTLKIH